MVVGECYTDELGNRARMIYNAKTVDFEALCGGSRARFRRPGKFQRRRETASGAERACLPRDAKGRGRPIYIFNSLSSAFASFRSRVSNPP